jgi:hypothetical protein
LIFGISEASFAQVLNRLFHLDTNLEPNVSNNVTPCQLEMAMSVAVANTAGISSQACSYCVVSQHPLLSLDLIKQQHQRDLERGMGRVALPKALDRKYPNAGKQWGWQWVFPATSHYTDKVTGEKRRHHLHESVVQKAVKEAVQKAGISKPASPHTFRLLLPRICWKTGMTFVLSRNSSDTATLALQ